MPSRFALYEQDDDHPEGWKRLAVFGSQRKAIAAASAIERKNPWMYSNSNLNRQYLLIEEI